MKIKTIIMMLTALLIMACSGQKSEQTTEKIYNTAEEMPVFKGGDEALMQWLNENIKYPDEAMRKGVSGRVLVRFFIDEDGNVQQPEIVESVDSMLDNEALRVVNAMPKWTPGKTNGKAVKVYFTLPVTFKFETQNDSIKAKN